MRRIWLLPWGLALVAAAGGCVSSPQRTVLKLDSTDPKWTSASCVAVRREALGYEDLSEARTIVGVVGNIAAPFAGTATSLAMRVSQNRSRSELNQRIRAACVSQPRSAPPRVTSAPR